VPSPRPDAGELIISSTATARPAGRPLRSLDEEGAQVGRDRRTASDRYREDLPLLGADAAGVGPRAQREVNRSCGVALRSSVACQR
jgi:hypothetical protein